MPAWMMDGHEKKNIFDYSHQCCHPAPAPPFCPLFFFFFFQQNNKIKKKQHKSSEYASIYGSLFFIEVSSQVRRNETKEMINGSLQTRLLRFTPLPCLPRFDNFI